MPQEISHAQPSSPRYPTKRRRPLLFPCYARAPRIDDQKAEAMARAPSAARKTNDLVSQVATVARSPAIDEVAMWRIEREARALMQSDPSGAHAVLGTVDALRGDEAATKEHYRIALKLEAQVATWVNYSTSLTLLDDNQGALDAARDGMAKHRGEPALAGRAIEAAIQSGNFGEAAELAQHYDKLVPDRPHRFADLARRLVEAIARGTMSEAGARTLIELLTTVQRREGIRTLTSGVGVVEGSFLYERGVRCTPKVASSMNWSLAGALAERPDLAEDPGRTLIGGFVGVADGGDA